MAVIQAGVRGAIAAAQYRRVIYAGNCIQTWWRGAATVARYGQELHAVVVIQVGVRCAIATARYRRAISAVTYIQNWWRDAAAVARYREELHSVVVIQAGVSGAIVAARCRGLSPRWHASRPAGGAQPL